MREKKKGNRDRKKIEIVLKRKKKIQISERVWRRYRSREQRENQRLK